ncbi:MAG: TetR/AcrR family transcriptional regulator [Chloroflexi bacterium]|nr:TetR/AcrR family transcriptional regulator [Chloroflexota bacterium]
MSSSSPISDVRTRILDEAAALFVQRGYHGISMREIAARAGVSKAALYYHFQDKEALFLGILMANLEQIEAIILRARSEEVTPQARIGRIFREIAALPPEQRAMIRLANQELPHLSAEAKERFVQLYHTRFAGAIEAILREGVASGHLRPMNARHAVWILLGMMYPFFYPGHERQLGDIEDAVDLMLAIYFEGANRRD